MKLLATPWFAIVAPALVGVACTALVVRGIGVYGWSLFIILPLLVSAFSSFLSCQKPGRSFASAYGISCLAAGLLGILLLVVAIDGLICLLMALPLTVVLCLPGTALGRYLAGCDFARKSRAALPCLAILCFPALAKFEATTLEPLQTRSVTTAVFIQAPPERVWQSVVAFPPITAPVNGIFRLGFAYPLSARIDGSGVGATRYCTFSTGSFVEPITHWSPPSHLAFDVAACPVPMQEFSPYRDLHAPHLDHYLIARHGEFRIRSVAGGTVLEGTTWYSDAIAPQWYWGPISDFVIHQIHQRVLDHIKHEAERR